MAIQLEFLKNIPYFSGLSPAEIESISKLVFEKTAERGEIILFEEESDRELYSVVSGAVKIFKTSSEGKEQILAIVRPGESFNEVSLFDGGLNPASAQAMGTVHLYGINSSNLNLVMREHPQVAINVIEVLARRLRHLISLVEDLSFKHVIGRIAKILLEHAGDGTGSGPRLTQQEMAAMAGTAREVVGRSLKALEGEGAISLERQRITIRDKEALKEIMGIY